MALSVNNNTTAINTYRNLTATQSSLGKSLEKLSSGYRINRAADDAAGLAISEGLRAQVNGLNQASRNAQDGINVVQTAEGALSTTTNILQRMRTLAVQASSSGSLSDDAKANIQAEVSQLKDELTRISKTTSFNGRQLLDGSASALTFQVGANKGESLTVNLGSDMSTSGLGLSGVGVTGGAVITATTAQPVNGAAGKGTVTITDAQLDSLDELKNLNGTVTVGSKSLDLATVKLTGADVAAQRTNLLSQLNTFFGAGTAAGGNGADLVISGAAGTAGESAQATADRAVSFAASTGADVAITKIDDAIKTVSTTRANLGAVQNRFEHTIANLGVAAENLTASESSIRDTDMAQEMTKFTSRQILAQAGTAMLAQAKNLPQSVLSLLQG